MEYTIKIIDDVVVILDGDRAITKLVFEKVDDAFDILSIHTDEQYQGQGLAKKVLYYFVDYTKDAKLIATCSYASHVLSMDLNVKNRLIDR